jgi:two-component sensor histidine kinase
MCYVTIFFLVGLSIHESRTFVWAGQRLVVPTWAISAELAARYATTWLALLLITKAVARRLGSHGWHDVARVLGAGITLAVLVVGALNAISCFVVPWGICTIDDQWLAIRLSALPGWLIASVSLIVAWSFGLKVKLFAEDEIRSNRLRGELADAQMAVLTVQLRPHFLFNTLQSIAALIHTDAPAAERMLGGLREMFQRSAELTETSVVSLADELALVRLYTDIEAVRFGDRLEISVDVDHVAEGASVPHLLLQPLVENSVLHAAARRGTGRVEVAAQVDPQREWLTLTVRDNGPGMTTVGASMGSGVGLTNTRARLQSQYGAKQELSIEDRSGEGMTVQMRFPYVEHTRRSQIPEVAMGP